MKKMIMTLAIAVSTLTAFAGEETVTPQVLNAFKNEFSTAKEVAWTVSSGYYKAAFTYNDKHVFAYYSTEGELLALTRYLSPDDLPLALLNTLKKNYSEYWISDLFEVAKNDGTNYYVTLEDADTKIVLKASGNTWVTHQKTKKA
jgi:Protein of unknown function (DUF2874).